LGQESEETDHFQEMSFKEAVNLGLEGRVVLITGAARGMGREYVRSFLRYGARVIAADRSWAPTGASGDEHAWREELEGQAEVLVVTMDLTLEAHVERGCAAAMARFGTIDVIINNAGMRQRDLYPPDGRVTTLETTPWDWQKMFETHVFGTLRVIKHFVGPMLEKGQGSIVNVASNGYDGHRANSREMPYQAAKAALVTMSRYLAEELKPRGIAVNVLLPGHTRTTGSDEQEALRRVRRLAEGEDGRRTLRLNPDHVVPLALFLAQQTASGVTGQVFDAMEWNQAHGYGGVERWAYAPDFEDPEVRPPR